MRGLINFLLGRRIGEKLVEGFEERDKLFSSSIGI